MSKNNGFNKGSYRTQSGRKQDICQYIGYVGYNTKIRIWHSCRSSVTAKKVKQIISPAHCRYTSTLVHVLVATQRLCQDIFVRH
jgi:hypothetical protein